jgi:hypothetical protein
MVEKPLFSTNLIMAESDIELERASTTEPKDTIRNKNISNWNDSQVLKQSSLMSSKGGGMSEDSKPIRTKISDKHIIANFEHLRKEEYTTKSQINILDEEGKSAMKECSSDFKVGLKVEKLPKLNLKRKKRGSNDREQVLD